MELNVFAQSLLFTGFKDYIAARMLINDNQVMQGLTLASSSVEKYIKAYLVTLGKKPRPVHLDNLKELKKQFGNANADVLNQLDENFLDLLGRTYSYRYYDNKTAVAYIGCAINQVLAELDFTIDFFEDTLEGYDTRTDEIIDSWYTMAKKEGNPILVKNNYIVEGVAKKEFMERPTTLYSLRINPVNLDEQLVLEMVLENQVIEYTGKINNGIQIRKKGMKDH